MVAEIFRIISLLWKQNSRLWLLILKIHRCLGRVFHMKRGKMNWKYGIE